MKNLVIPILILLSGCAATEKMPYEKAVVIGDESYSSLSTNQVELVDNSIDSFLKESNACINNEYPSSFLVRLSKDGYVKHVWFKNDSDYNKCLNSELMKFKFTNPTGVEIYIPFEFTDEKSLIGISTNYYFGYDNRIELYGVGVLSEENSELVLSFNDLMISMRPNDEKLETHIGELSLWVSFYDNGCDNQDPAVERCENGGFNHAYSGESVLVDRNLSSDNPIKLKNIRFKLCVACVSNEELESSAWFAMHIESNTGKFNAPGLHGQIHSSNKSLKDAP